MNNRDAANGREGFNVLYIVAAVVAIVGLADAVYLTVHHLTGANVRCTVVAGCDAVLMSEYATLAGVPLAAFGAAAYFAAFSLSVLIAFGHERWRTPFRVLIATMLLMTVWLLYLQAVVIKAFCFYCLISAAVTITLAALAFIDFFLNRRHGRFG